VISAYLARRYGIQLNDIIRVNVQFHLDLAVIYWQAIRAHGSCGHAHFVILVIPNDLDEKIFTLISTRA
jgi:hypothetical protein